MLILSRKKDEKIVINNDIQIQIIDIKSDTVKIGIDAPKHIKIYREEVWDNIQSENQRAAASTDSEMVPHSIQELHEHLSSRVEQASDDGSNQSSNEE